MNPSQMSASSAEDDDGPDRDSACTPRWIADAVGEVDLDPCSNERSHIRARRVFRLDLGQDALVLAKYVTLTWLLWLNPPYGRGLVIQFVRAFIHHRFIFLLRYDASTDWFALLYERTERIAFPRIRVDFEAPPGAEFTPGNPFPHALFYAHAEDVSDEIHATCYVVDTGNRNPRGKIR